MADDTCSIVSGSTASPLLFDSVSNKIFEWEKIQEISTINEILSPVIPLQSYIDNEKDSFNNYVDLNQCVFLNEDSLPLTVHKKDETENIQTDSQVDMLDSQPTQFYNETAMYQPKTNETSAYMETSKVNVSSLSFSASFVEEAFQKLTFDSYDNNDGSGSTSSTIPPCSISKFNSLTTMPSSESCCSHNKDTEIKRMHLTVPKGWMVNDKPLEKSKTTANTFKVHETEVNTLCRLNKLYDEILKKIEQKKPSADHLEKLQNVTEKLSKNQENERLKLSVKLKSHTSDQEVRVKYERRLKLLDERHSLLLMALSKHRELIHKITLQRFQEIHGSNVEHVTKKGSSHYIVQNSTNSVSEVINLAPDNSLISHVPNSGLAYKDTLELSQNTVMIEPSEESHQQTVSIEPGLQSGMEPEPDLLPNCQNSTNCLEMLIDHQAVIISEHPNVHSSSSEHMNISKCDAVANTNTEYFPSRLQDNVTKQMMAKEKLFFSEQDHNHREMIPLKNCPKASLRINFNQSQSIITASSANINVANIESLSVVETLPWEDESSQAVIDLTLESCGISVEPFPRIDTVDLTQDSAVGDADVVTDLQKKPVKPTLDQSDQHILTCPADQYSAPHSSQQQQLEAFNSDLTMNHVTQTSSQGYVRIDHPNTADYLIPSSKMTATKDDFDPVIQPHSPSSTVSSSFFPVTSKEMMRRFERKFQNPASESIVPVSLDVTGDTGTPITIHSKKQHDVSHHYVIKTSDISNLSNSTQTPLSVSINRKNVENVTSNKVESPTHHQLVFFQPITGSQKMGKSNKSVMTKEKASRKRGRPKKENSCSEQAANLKKRSLANNDIVKYIPVIVEGSAGGQMKQVSPMSASWSSDIHHSTFSAGPTLDHTNLILKSSDEVLKAHDTSNKAGKSADLNPKMDDQIKLPHITSDQNKLLIKSIELIANVEVLHTSKDFPVSFWQEDFAEIKLSELLWNSVDEW